MGAVVVDTHALLWYLFEPQRLSPAALSSIRQAVSVGDPVYLSAISIVEVCYLVEKGRLASDTLNQMISALRPPSGGLIVASVELGVAQTLQQIPRDVVPDMPDRIIAATALHLGLPLITRDS